MKLIPKARPVRIRISSGGIEHSSLTSLKEHFSLEDVMGLIANGSLTRWLKQCGESDLASEMECASEGDKMDVLKSFFPELKRIKPEIELVKYLYHSGQEKTAAYLFNSDLINDINAIKQAWMYYIGGINYFPLFYNHWEEDGELAFLFAQACVNGDFEIQDHNSVEMVLDKAIELGSRQALLLKGTDEWKKYIHPGTRFYNVDKERMKSVVLDIFDGGRIPSRFNNENERTIAFFAKFCREISGKRSSNYDHYMLEFNKYKDEQSANSIIAHELLLLEAIIKESYQKDGWDLLRSTDVVSPAITLYKDQYYIVQNRKFPKRLRFVLEHMFDE